MVSWGKIFLSLLFLHCQKNSSIDVLSRIIVPTKSGFSEDLLARETLSANFSENPVLLDFLLSTKKFFSPLLYPKANVSPLLIGKFEGKATIF